MGESVVPVWQIEDLLNLKMDEVHFKTDGVSTQSYTLLKGYPWASIPYELGSSVRKRGNHYICDTKLEERSCQIN